MQGPHTVSQAWEQFILPGMVSNLQVDTALYIFAAGERRVLELLLLRFDIPLNVVLFLRLDLSWCPGELYAASDLAGTTTGQQMGECADHQPSSRTWGWQPAHVSRNRF